MPLPPPPGRSGPTPPGGAPARRQFTPPAPISSVNWRAADFQGLIHVFSTDGRKQTVATKHGERETVQCDDVVVFCSDGSVLRFPAQPVFGAVITQQLTAGGLVVGVVGQGVAEAGRNAPWVIVEPDEAQMAWVQEAWGSITDAQGNLTVEPATEEEVQKQQHQNEAPF